MRCLGNQHSLAASSTDLLSLDEWLEIGVLKDRD